jgi:hypothetical protein
MATNKIKKGGSDDLRLQVTRPARSARLVDESSIDGKLGRGHDVYVYGFDGLLVVVDVERVSMSDRAELVATATADTNSIHRGATTTVAQAGHGYQVQLPGGRAAGFDVDDTAHMVAAEGVLFIHTGDEARLASDLQTIRNEQVSQSN